MLANGFRRLEQTCRLVTPASAVFPCRAASWSPPRTASTWSRSVPTSGVRARAARFRAPRLAARHDVAEHHRVGTTTRRRRCGAWSGPAGGPWSVNERRPVHSGTMVVPRDRMVERVARGQPRRDAGAAVVPVDVASTARGDRYVGPDDLRDPTVLQLVEPGPKRWCRAMTALRLARNVFWVDRPESSAICCTRSVGVVVVARAERTVEVHALLQRHSGRTSSTGPVDCHPSRSAWATSTSGKSDGVCPARASHRVSAVNAADHRAAESSTSRGPTGRAARTT